jgi:hypothetical protein
MVGVLCKRLENQSYGANVGVELINTLLLCNGEPGTSEGWRYN